MIGVVVATHGKLAEEMIRTAEAVVGKLAQVKPVSGGGTDPDIRAQLKEAIKSVDTGDGVLLLTGLLGGSPTNLCVSFVQERQGGDRTHGHPPPLLHGQRPRSC